MSVVGSEAGVLEGDGVAVETGVGDGDGVGVSVATADGEAVGLPDGLDVSDGVGAGAGDGSTVGVDCVESATANSPRPIGAANANVATPRVRTHSLGERLTLMATVNHPIAFYV